MSQRAHERLDEYIIPAGPEAAIALMEDAIADLVPEELIPLDQIDPRGRLRGQEQV